MKLETLHFMQQLLELTEKYINRTLTKKERKRLKKLVLKNKDNLIFFKKKLIDRSRSQLFHDFDSDTAFEAFEPMLDYKSKKIFTKKWIPYAASFIGVLATLVMILQNGPTEDVVATNSKDQINSENNIVLTLDDGTKKILNSSQSTTIAEKDGKPIVRTTNSGLDYSPAKNINSYGLHKIYIPNGQKFKLTLSDGTMVWLNSGSTLTFPSRFDKTTSNRMVHLKGEAYFDVAEDKSFPFIVNVDDLNIKVLGTEFNVSAYENQQAVATTLVEGSVNLSDANQLNNSITLKPNQQGKFDKYNKNLDSKRVDVSLFTAWMQNKIVFKDMPMSQILVQIERTYNVDITNKNKKIAGEHFTGQFDVEDIETIFKVLSTAINFEYEITTNQIIIKE